MNRELRKNDEMIENPELLKEKERSTSTSGSGHTDSGVFDKSYLEFIEQEQVKNPYDTPIRPDAFELSDEEKMAKIEPLFKEIMETLGLDLTDDSLADTPKRVAKMYVKEIFKGLNPANKPSMSSFENSYNYNEMLVEKNITVFSNCEHHFVPIHGKAHVAYIPSGKVIGLSKLNRIVDYYCSRPQVQERLTIQIAQDLQKVLGTKDVAVIIEADHMCVASRGIKDVNSSTTTAQYLGKFKKGKYRKELFRHIDQSNRK